MHVLEELALGRGGVSHDAHVDVPPQLDPLRRLLVDPAQKHQQHPALHLFFLSFCNKRSGIGLRCTFCVIFLHQVTIPCDAQTEIKGTRASTLSVGAGQLCCIWAQQQLFVLPHPQCRHLRPIKSSALSVQRKGQSLGCPPPLQHYPNERRSLGRNLYLYGVYSRGGMNIGFPLLRLCPRPHHAATLTTASTSTEGRKKRTHEQRTKHPTHFFAPGGRTYQPRPPDSSRKTFCERSRGRADTATSTNE